MSSHHYNHAFAGNTEIAPTRILAVHFSPIQGNGPAAIACSKLVSDAVLEHSVSGRPAGISMRGTYTAPGVGHHIVHLHPETYLIEGYTDFTPNGAKHYDAECKPVGCTRREGRLLKHHGDLLPAHRGALLFTPIPA